MLIVQLFCILIFSKIKFGQANNEPPEYEMNVLINWDRSKGMQNLFGSDERFQLYLHRMIRQYGMATQTLIASAKTGHYDLATLKIAPQQQIAIQNAVEAERKRKGKEKIGEGIGTSMNSENGIKFILLIRMKNIPGVQKEIEKLPNENEVLICSYEKEDKCKIVNDESMFIRRPTRTIFFSNYLQNTHFLKFEKIECPHDEKVNERNVSQSVVIIPKENGMEYFGPICPSDEYRIHLLVDGQNYNAIFKCDETIPFHKNTYHFSKDKCQLLKENETFYNLSNLQGLLRMLNIVKFSPDFVAMMKELQKRSKQQFVPKPTLPSPSHSHVPNKSSATNLGKQFSQQYAHSRQSHSISPKIPPPSVVIPPAQKVAPQFSPELMKQLADKLAPYFIKNMPTQFRTQLQHQISQAGISPRTVSHIEHSLNQSQSPNQIYRSSVGASEIGQNSLPTNFQPSKIVGTSTQQQPQTHIPPVEISPQSRIHQYAQSSHQSHQNPLLIDDSIITIVAKKIWEQIVKEQPVLAKRLSPEDIKPIVFQFLQKQRQQIQFNSQPSHVGSPSQSQHFLSSGKWQQQFNLSNSSQQILNNLAQNLQQHLANSKSLQNADKSYDEPVQIIGSSSARKQPQLQIPQKIYGQKIGPFQFPSVDSASQQPVEASASRKAMPIQTENPPQHESPSPSIQGHQPNIDLEFNLAPTGSSNKQTKQKQFLHSFEQRPSPFNLQMSEQEINDEQINLGLGLGGQKRGPNDKDEEGPSEKNAAKKAKKY